MAIVFAVTEKPAKVGDVIYGMVPGLTAYELECGTQVYAAEQCLIACEDDNLDEYQALEAIEINTEDYAEITHHTNEALRSLLGYIHLNK